MTAKTHRTCFAIRAAALSAAAGILAGAAPAGQITVFDGLLETPITAKGRAWTYGDVRADMPKSLLEPHDYYEGEVHVRFEVLAKPSRYRSIRWQVSWKSGTRGVAESNLPPASRVGQVFERQFDPYTMMVPPEGFGFPKGGEREAFGEGMSRAGYYTVLGVGEIDNCKSVHLPLLVHLTMTLVAKGHEYDPNRFSFEGLRHEELIHLRSVKACLDRGLLGQAYRLAESAARSKDEGKAAAARSVLASLDRWAETRLAMCERVKEHEPVVAITKLREFAARLSGCRKARELLERARAWSREDATRNEIRARPLYDRFDRLANELRDSCAEGGDPGGRGDEKEQLRLLASALQERFPGTPSARRALAQAEELCIAVTQEVLSGRTPAQGTKTE
jgi:hypothetical protein